MKKRQFKLIKSYPNSENVGSVYKQGDFMGRPVYFKDGSYLDPADVENNPEFFEEIIEKEYEILSFENKVAGKWVNVGLNRFQYEGDLIKHLDFMLSSESNYISTIRRLSDNEVFSINDKVTHPCGETYTIKSCKISNIDNNPDIITEKGTYGLLGLCIKKAKPFLFVTHDGYKMFEGEDYLAIDPKDYSLVWSIADPELLNSSWLKFANCKFAEEYIILNKPVLSIDDVLGLLEHKTLKPTWNWDRTTPSFERDIKALVKSRL